MMKIWNDPWGDIETPADGSRRGRRVSKDHPFEFWWAKDGTYVMLWLELSEELDLEVTPPKTRDIEVLVSKTDRLTHGMAIRLLDNSRRDLFHALCCDVVDATLNCSSKAEAVGAAIDRLWSWHHLMRAGSSSLLSPESQRGLIAELTTLVELIEPLTGLHRAIASWSGPLGSPRDFELGHVYVECKSHRGGARPFVAISSEYQLDLVEDSRSFLHVVEVAAASDTVKTTTVTRLCNDLGNLCLVKSPDSLTMLNELLARIGFRREHDYSDFHWLIGATHLYEITETFPRIAASKLDTGVLNVNYELSLKESQPYLVPESALAQAMEL